MKTPIVIFDPASVSRLVRFRAEGNRMFAILSGIPFLQKQ
jgi:hypothetical protein